MSTSIQKWQFTGLHQSISTQTARIAAFERLVSGLWGVFIVSVLSVVFLAGFAFLPGRY